MRLSGSAALAGLALLTACASAPPARNGYDLLDVSVAVTPDIAARTIAGRERLRLRIADARELRFDANALALRSVHIDGAPGQWSAVDGAVVIGGAFRRGQVVTIDLAYDGAPARGLTIADDVVYTTYFTCDWMYCALDRPGDKAPVTIELALPDGWRAYAPGAASETRDAEARRVLRWREERAYPVYLYGFAAGALTEVRQAAGETELVFASAHAGADELAAMFGETGRMLEFYRAIAGVPFPHVRYVQLLVPGQEAQEAAGFSVLGDDTVRPVLENPHEDWGAAHELAHQYWGNLVTCADWSEFWLNEGMTTFMVAAWKQHRWGEADYQREIELARRRWQAARDAGWDRPLAFSGPYPDLRTRRAIQYSKGMLFLVELRRTLGEEAFWRGIRAYTRAHAGGTVESADLERALERASGRDLSALFAQWVYE